MFMEEPALGSVVVRCSDGGFMAVTRGTFFLHLTGRLGFGRSVYARRCVEELPLTRGFIVDAATSVADAASVILERAEDRHDDFVLRFEDGALGTASVAALFEELAYAYAFAARQNALILDSAGEGICGVDGEGLITFANIAAARITGYDVAELIGSSLERRRSRP
jgi:PAS domain-containing protein